MLFDTLKSSEHADAAWVVKRFGGDTITEVGRNKDLHWNSMDRVMRLHEKRIAPQSEDLADQILSDLSYMATVNAVAPGFYAGLSQFRPAFKAIRNRRDTLYTPWPAARSLYLHSDLKEVQHFISKVRTPADAIPPGTLEDYRPIDNPLPNAFGTANLVDEEIEMFQADPELAKHIDANGGIPCGFNLIGHRLLADKERQTIITIAKATGGIATGAFSEAISNVIGQVNDPDKIVVAQAMTLWRKDFAANTPKLDRSFVAWEIGRISETAIGLSPRPEDNRIWSQDDIAHLTNLYRFMLPLAEDAITALLMPAYFDYQLEQVISGQEAVSEATADKVKSANTGKISRKKARARRTYRLVRAVVAPKEPPFEDAKPSNTQAAQSRSSARNEPETQVDVQGFWRRLRSGSIGKTQHGIPVVGKTWVQSHRRWLDKPETVGLARMKEPLGPYLSNKGEA